MLHLEYEVSLAYTVTSKNQASGTKERWAKEQVWDTKHLEVLLSAPGSAGREVCHQRLCYRDKEGQKSHARQCLGLRLRFHQLVVLEDEAFATLSSDPWPLCRSSPHVSSSCSIDLKGLRSKRCSICRSGRWQDAVTPRLTVLEECSIRMT